MFGVCVCVQDFYKLEEGHSAKRADPVVVVEIMDALEYLHSHYQPLVIHCDLKPTRTSFLLKT